MGKITNFFRKLTTKHIIFLIIAIVMMCSGAIYAQFKYIEYIRDDYIDFAISKIEQNFDERTITISGEITRNTLEAFILIDLLKFDKVILDSNGGKALAAEGISMLIRAYELDTEVQEGGRCASACPWVFQSGINRIAHKNSVFLYHFVSSYDKKIVDGHEILIYNVENSKIGTKRMFEDMESYGLKPTFKDLIHIGYDYIYTPEQINDYNIFTRIVE